jgi:MFS transporter, ACS family, tartrate transporter
MSGAPTRLASKIRWRLVLPCLTFMLLSSLDRANVSFAALQMNTDLGMTPEQYGFGAGILFVGFLAGQFPSILLQQRFGMRLWISACAVIWGATAAGLAFVQSHEAYYALRLLLGFAEGGLAPGIVLYLRQWATEQERASTFAAPMLAIPLSIIIGSPLSGWLMGTANPFGIDGWRWMFLVEGLPTLFLGAIAYFYFPNSPDEARWLGEDERRWLKSNSAHRPTEGHSPQNDWTAFKEPRVWLSALLWFCLLSGAYGIMFWLPLLVGQLSALSELQIGFVNSLPWLGVALGIYFNAKHSDKTQERILHVAVPAAITGFAIIIASFTGSSGLGLIALFVAGLGLGGAQGAFWAVPTTILNSGTIAVGVVVINIFGSAGGMVMPHAIGWIRQVTGSFVLPIYLVAAVLFMAAATVGVLSASMKQIRKAA